MAINFHPLFMFLNFVEELICKNIEWVIKKIVIILNRCEKLIRNHCWCVHENIDQPDPNASIPPWISLLTNTNNLRQSIVSETFEQLKIWFVFFFNENLDSFKPGAFFHIMIYFLELFHQSKFHLVFHQSLQAFKFNIKFCSILLFY